MTKHELLRQAARLMEGGGSPGLYDLAACTIRQNLAGNALETLGALIKVGPVWDGDLPSKAGRNTLIELGLAEKVIVQGRQGFQAATHRGWNVYNAVLDEPPGAQVMSMADREAAP